MTDLNDYEPASKLNATLSKGLVTIWEKLGRPTDCSTNAGWIMLDQCLNAWTVFYPQEVADWEHDRKIDLGTEMSLQQIVKKDGGYHQMAYPPTLFKLLKAMLPEQKLQNKKFVRALTIRHPILKITNLKL